VSPGEFIRFSIFTRQSLISCKFLNLLNNLLLIVTSRPRKGSATPAQRSNPVLLKSDVAGRSQPASEDELRGWDAGAQVNTTDACQGPAEARDQLKVVAVVA
jgi:hypothetical protein